MRHNVGDGKVIAEEKIFEAERGEENQAAGGHPGLARTFDQQRMPRNNRRNAPAESINRAYKRQDECKGTEYIHGDPAYPPELPGALHAAWFGGFGRGATFTSRRRFILGSAFRLHNFGHESSLRTRPAFHQGLGLVYKCIWQWVGTNVADRKRLPFPLQHKIHAPGEAPNTSCRNRAADAHALAICRAAQSLQFSDGVVVSFAFSVAQPCQETQRSDDYTDSHSKFCLFLHDGTPTAPSIRQCVGFYHT